MELEVKGHSGCQIEIVNENNQLFVYKTTDDTSYLKRLVFQAEKQKTASTQEYQHIRVPRIFDIQVTDTRATVKMQYIYSKNFIEFFEQAGFEQIDYFIGALKCFLEYEIENSSVQKVSASLFVNKFTDIYRKIQDNTICKDRKDLNTIMLKCENFFESMNDIMIPVGKCHGDLTFSNILFNGNNYYLIDFLDSFIETPLQDIVKIRQDSKYHWSQQMYVKPYDKVRLDITYRKIDEEIDTYFRNKYEWYRNYYTVMQIINMLRILPYAKEERIIKYLVTVLDSLLNNNKDEELTLLSQATKTSNSSTLIIPIAADKPEYSEHIPSVFKVADDGTLLCIKAILGIDYSSFDKIYFTILSKFDKKYSLAERLRLQFKMHSIKNAEVVILDTPTSSQPETVYQTICKKCVDGNVFIKDADCYLEGEISKDNQIAIYPLESLKLVNPQDKSYVAVDDMYYVTNIIEKRIVSHYFTAGGYSFEDANQYCEYYKRFEGVKHLYLSHIIYAMLLDGILFRPIIANKFIDFE